jgi:hypothetical protein
MFSVLNRLDEPVMLSLGSGEVIVSIPFHSSTLNHDNTSLTHTNLISLVTQ